MRTKLISLLLMCALALSACDSSEERAEKHYQRGVELYESGDNARALVELSNVFQLNPDHRGGRLLAAQIQEEFGNLPAAFRHYRAVVELDPEDYEAQRESARLSAEFGDWNVATRQVEIARKLIGEDAVDPALEATELAVAYQEARSAFDTEAQQRIADEAAPLLIEYPGYGMLSQIVIDNQLRLRDWTAALASIGEAITQHPGNKSYYFMRLGVLDTLGMSDEIEAQLREMAQIFDDGDTNRRLLSWYMSQRRVADAEEWLREQVAANALQAEPQMLLVGFLEQTAGRAAALKEINRILEQTPQDGPNHALYRSARAGLVFDQGDHDAAIAELQDILSDAKPSDQTRRIKIVLAKMFNELDNRDEAEALVSSVLEEDGTEIDALRLRASWMIDDDRPDDALLELRRALDQDPQDPRTLTLMARAHARAGGHDLSGDMLALAVEASGNAPEETLRYAEFLIQDNRLMAAESVLIDALRVRNDDIGVLRMLGDIYVELQDWGRLRGIIEALQKQGATQAASNLTARMLTAQGRQEDLEDFLARLAGSAGGNTQIVATVVRLRLARGDVQGALDFVRTQLTENPDDPDLRFIAARVFASSGETNQAMEELRSLIAQSPGTERYWITLYELTREKEGAEGAREVLDTAVTAVADDRRLAWLQASELEVAGDIDGAIAIYERLYEQNSDALIVANNLASLLASNTDDPENLKRAYTIARRLNGTDVPAFQDTYGWILVRRGEAEKALPYLEPAAANFPQDPAVQYHLARAYDLAGRPEDALAAYQGTMTLLGMRETPAPFQADVEEGIARLSQLTRVEN